MTTADILREEGRIEGRNQVLREWLLRMLNQRFRPLPEDVVTRIDATGPADHDVWFDRAITAPTLADVFGDG